MVLESGFAHGEGGNALHEKPLFNAVTSGQPLESYSGSFNAIDELLSPYHRTAIHCGMNYLTPFAMHNVDSLSDKEVVEQAQHYGEKVASISEQILAGTL